MQIVIRLRNIHFLKKQIRHIIVIMLSRVPALPEALPQHSRHRCGLDKLGPRANNRYNFFYVQCSLLQQLYILSVFNILHGVFRIKNGLCRVRHQLIIHVGVGRRHHDEIRALQQLL